MTGHTPTPWTILKGMSGRATHFGIEDCLVDASLGSCCYQGDRADIWNPEADEANAAFIVTACNAHDQLVRAVNLGLGLLEGFQDADRCEDGEEPIVAPVIEQMRTALRAAGVLEEVEAK